jgi:hypothetical protein
MAILKSLLVTGAVCILKHQGECRWRHVVEVGDLCVDLCVCKIAGGDRPIALTITICFGFMIFSRIYQIRWRQDAILYKSCRVSTFDRILQSHRFVIMSQFQCGLATIAGAAAVLYMGNIEYDEREWNFVHDEQINNRGISFHRRWKWSHFERLHFCAWINEQLMFYSLSVNSVKKCIYKH